MGVEVEDAEFFAGGPEGPDRPQGQGMLSPQADRDRPARRRFDRLFDRRQGGGGIPPAVDRSGGVDPEPVGAKPQFGVVELDLPGSFQDFPRSGGGPGEVGDGLLQRYGDDDDRRPRGRNVGRRLGPVVQKLIGEGRDG